MTRVGLYGGTFSPPHLGHLHAAREFAEAMRLDKLIIMPAGIPPHKRETLHIDGEKRLEMCRLTFGSIPCAEVSSLETDRAGASYTVDTLRALERDGEKIFMLCGDDMFLTLDAWYRSAEIFSRAVIVCMRRYLTDDAELRRKCDEYTEKYSASVEFIDAPAFPVSSSHVRELLADGKSCRGLLEEKTERFIVENKIYSCHAFDTERSNT